jgi:U2 small nuclear ribonucleoprotein A'
LLLARNRINSFALGLGKSLPNLRTLVLTQNFVAELADLDPLGELKKLTHISLVENPVASKEVRNMSIKMDGDKHAKE